MIRRRKVRRQRGERFLLLHFWELESPAFEALSADAVRVYLSIRKRLDFDAGNNGSVPFSHRDAAVVLHAGGWRRGSNALAELQHFGFIKLRNGGEPGPNIRLAAEWQLTAFECGGQPASKAFTRHDGEPFEPPYTRAKKQPPIFTVKTGRLHGEDSSPGPNPSKQGQNGKTVFTVKTVSGGRRLHGEDTGNNTTHGGPPDQAPIPSPSDPMAAVQVGRSESDSEQEASGAAAKRP